MESRKPRLATCKAFAGFLIRQYCPVRIYEDGALLRSLVVEKQHAGRMGTRINLFLSLPLSSIEQLRIKQEMDSIGKTPVTDSSP
jgi:hypothetical protein